MPSVLKVPAVKDEAEDFYHLFELWNAVERANDDIVFDFSECESFMQNGVAFLGGLAHYVEHRGHSATLAWDTLGPEVRAIFSQNGFLEHFGIPGEKTGGNSVAFRRDTELDKESLLAYLIQDWIGTGRVKLSELARQAIVSTTWEIYANAFEHGNSPVGVFSCGQYYPNQQILELTVADFGGGIPLRVRAFLAQPKLSAPEALEWAFERGNTTRREAGIARGMGLDLLRDFVVVNRGKLEIYSGDGYAVVDALASLPKGRQLQFGKSIVKFGGTIANIVFRCTPHYYRLTSEISERPLF